MVAPVTRTRFDQFGKQMVRDALESHGAVETNAEVPAAFGGALGLIHFGRRRGSTWATATRRDRDPSHLGWIRVRMDPRRV